MNKYEIVLLIVAGFVAVLAFLAQSVAGLGVVFLVLFAIHRGWLRE